MHVQLNHETEKEKNNANLIKVLKSNYHHKDWVESHKAKPFKVRRNEGRRNLLIEGIRSF